MQNHEIDSNCSGTEKDDSLLRDIRQELDRSCAALDGNTLSRLHRIRSEVVTRRRSWLQPWLWRFGALATAMALVVAMSVAWRGNGAGDAGTPALEDIEILASNEALEFYADYEFYQWLAQN